VLTSVEETSKNQLLSGQEFMGDAPELSHFSLLRNSSPKTGVLEHCHEGELNGCFCISRGISF